MDPERMEKLLSQAETANQALRSALDAISQALIQAHEQLAANEHELRKLKLMVNAMQGDKVPESLRRKIIRRDHMVCQYCGRQGTETSDPDGQPWEIDHVVSRHNGGPTHSGNLALACASCNGRKSGRSPCEYIRSIAPSARTDPRQCLATGVRPTTRRRIPVAERYSADELYRAYLEQARNRKAACTALFGYADATTLAVLDQAIRAQVADVPAFLQRPESEA